MRELIGSVNTSAFVGTNPTDESIVSGLPVIPTVVALDVVECVEAFSIRPVHSSRSSAAGSIDSARRAGIHAASSPNKNIARTTPDNTTGSRVVA